MNISQASTASALVGHSQSLVAQYNELTTNFNQLDNQPPRTQLSQIQDMRARLTTLRTTTNEMLERISLLAIQGEQSDDMATIQNNLSGMSFDGLEICIESKHQQLTAAAAQQDQPAAQQQEGNRPAVGTMSSQEFDDAFEVGAMPDAYADSTMGILSMQLQELYPTVDQAKSTPLTIVSLCSGSCRSEALLLQRLKDDGYQVGKLVLMDSCFHEENRRAPLERLVEGELTSEVQCLTSFGALANWIHDNPQTVHAVVSFNFQMASFFSIDESIPMYQQALENRYRLENNYTNFLADAQTQNSNADVTPETNLRAQYIAVHSDENGEDHPNITSKALSSASVDAQASLNKTIDELKKYGLSVPNH